MTQHSSTGGGAMSVRADLESDKHTLSVSEFVKERLYFVTFKNKTHRNSTDVHYFNTDDELVYHNYYDDFGPLTLAAISKYISKVRYKLRSPGLASKAIVHFSSPDEKKRVNAAFLMGAFAIVELDMSPTEVFNRLNSLKLPFISFQDATEGESQYKVRLIDCLNSLRKAVYFGLVDFDDFDAAEFERAESIRQGDISWIVPQKFLAFSGPVDNPGDDCYHPPEFYLDYFKKHDVRTVIRLNVKVYNAKSFTSAGINHYELYFTDGTYPSHNIVTRFFEITENNPGAVAVHCKAGLGRTGCLIGAYLVKHYRMAALEAIAWLRMCRPGCIIGYQQSWLQEMEPALWNIGDTFRTRYNGAADRIPHHKFGIYSCKWNTAEKSSYEGHGQKQSDEDDSVKPLPAHMIASQRQRTCEHETQGERLVNVKKCRDSQLSSILKHKPMKTTRSLKKPQ